MDARLARFASALKLRLELGFAPAERVEIRPSPERFSTRKQPLLRFEMRPRFYA